MLPYSDMHGYIPCGIVGYCAGACDYTCIDKTVRLQHGLAAPRCGLGFSGKATGAQIKDKSPRQWIVSSNSFWHSRQRSNLWLMQGGAGISVDAVGDRFDGSLMVCWFTDNRMLLQCASK